MFTKGCRMRSPIQNELIHEPENRNMIAKKSMLNMFQNTKCITGSKDSKINIHNRTVASFLLPLCTSIQRSLASCRFLLQKPLGLGTAFSQELENLTFPDENMGSNLLEGMVTAKHTSAHHYFGYHFMDCETIVANIINLRNAGADNLPLHFVWYCLRSGKRPTLFPGRESES